MDDIEFSALVKLAATDPHGFRARKRQLLLAEVGKAPEHKRAALHALVETLLEEDAALTPLDAAASAFNRAQQSYVQLLDALAPLGQGTRPATAAERYSGIDSRT